MLRMTQKTKTSKIMILMMMMMRGTFFHIDHDEQVFVPDSDPKFLVV